MTSFHEALSDGDEIEGRVDDHGARRIVQLSMCDDADGHVVLKLRPDQAERFGRWLIKAAAVARSELLR